jgi:upstream activation factor subunit UAF30
MDVGADKLRREIQIILKDADLNTLSSKKVRQMLEALFKCDFTERKKEIDDILMSEITTRDTTQTNNDEQEDNDDDAQVETSDDDKPAPSHTKKNKKQQRRTNHHNNNQSVTTITKSDEELAMEIHQQENRPSLRHSRPVKSTSSLSTKKTSAIKVERRKTSYNKELDLSDQLASVVGGNQMPRSEVVKRMWAYFKEHNLLDPHNKQFVNCDETLAKLFGRKRIRAFGMLKDLTKHMSDPDKQ